jgi:hypothetical protein
VGVEIEVAERFPVVALVSSAGGLDALTRVLAPLPPAFPAAVIALQHTSPTGPSCSRASSNGAPRYRSSSLTTATRSYPGRSW